MGGTCIPPPPCLGWLSTLPNINKGLRSLLYPNGVHSLFLEEFLGINLKLQTIVIVTMAIKPISGLGGSYLVKGLSAEN